MSIKPLADRVVAKKDAATSTTASGILLGEAKEKPNTATVESIGPDVKSIKKGDRIAQLVLAPVTRCEPVEVDEVFDTERGAGGFGSTGR